MAKIESANRSLRILIVDDEEQIGALLKQFIELEGHRVSTARDGETGCKMLQENEFDILVTDLRMPGMGGLGLLTWLQEQGPSIPAIVISAYGDIEDAVAAMHRGAADYLVKPFEPEELLLRITRTVRNHRMERSLRVRESLERRPSAGTANNSTGRLESANPAMNTVLDMAKRAAPSTASILISGESGTGKEVLANWIHQLSDRADKPFVPINLGGIPESLLETELFGHEKGSFTGADRRKTGMFEVANGGTLFLDEIGDMPLQLQVKLLRVLQDRRIQRLGSTIALPIDVRIIAASHRDLAAAVKAGTFREDLLYRLNVIPLHLPALRDRREDLPDLVNFLLRKHARSGAARSVSPEALESLDRYPFPGNIRELENMIERAIILCDGPLLRVKDFGLPALSPPVADCVEEPATPCRGSNNHEDGSILDLKPAPPAGSTLAAIEKWAILRELERNGGRRANSADILGISRRTLLNKLTEYDIESERS